MATYNTNIDGDNSGLLSNLNTAKTNGETIHTISDGGSSPSLHCFVFQPTNFYTKTANHQSLTGWDLVEDIFGYRDIQLHLIRGVTNGKFFQEDGKVEGASSGYTGFGGLLSAINTLIGSDDNVNFLGLGTEGSFAAIKAAVSSTLDGKIARVVCQQPVNKIPSGTFSGFNLPTAETITQDTMNSKDAMFYFQDGNPNFSSDTAAADDPDWKPIRQASMFTPDGTGAQIYLINNFAWQYVPTARNTSTARS